MKKSSFSKRTPPLPKQIPKIIKTQQKLTKTLQDSEISGFGIGIGNSIAHNLMNGVFSTTETSFPPQTDRDNCNHIMTELDTCILLIRDCEDLYNKLNLHKCQI
jgi:hypothetical protein